MKLSILIPTLPERTELCESLMAKIVKQVVALSTKDGIDYFEKIEILQDPREKGTVSIGQKRNDLLFVASGEYLCFVDDDDRVAEDYVETLIRGIDSAPDCLSLRGEYYENGKHMGTFEHSIKYNKWETVNGPIKFFRTPNHLNCIKSSIAKQFKFPTSNFGEDHKWSKQLHESGLLKKEYYIDRVLYFYDYVTK